MPAGSCIGLKPLKEASEPVKGCPHCNAPIAGIQRYARITNKTMIDLMDRKHTLQQSQALQCASAELKRLIDDPDEAALAEGVNVEVVQQYLRRFGALVQACTRPPSLMVTPHLDSSCVVPAVACFVRAGTRCQHLQVLIGSCT